MLFRSNIKYADKLKCVKINSSPQGATVYWNKGQIHNTTPIVIDSVESGKYNLRLSYSGYYSKDTVIVVDNDLLNLFFRLNPKLGSLQIRCIPAWTDSVILMDDQDNKIKTYYSENFPFDFPKLAPGKYQFIILRNY